MSLLNFKWVNINGIIKLLDRGLRLYPIRNRRQEGIKMINQAVQSIKDHLKMGKPIHNVIESIAFYTYEMFIGNLNEAKELIQSGNCTNAITKIQEAKIHIKKAERMTLKLLQEEKLEE